MKEKDASQEIYFQNLRKMSAQQKIEVFYQLYDLARNLKAAGFKAQFPHLTDKEIWEKVKESFLHAKH